MVQLTINGKARDLDIEPNAPLLWVLRDELGLTGTKFGCGIGACGACTVHIDGVATRSCVTPIERVAGKSVTTIEALSPSSTHAVQQAWIAEDVVQCGYCQSGQIMAAVALLQWGVSLDAAIAVGAYLVIHALDGNVLVPLLFSEAVAIHPVAIIVAILFFGGIWGVWGVFFAIPLAVLVKAVITAWPKKAA